MDSAQNIHMAELVLDAFAKKVAIETQVAQSQLHSLLGYGSAASVFSLSDQTVVRALSFDGFKPDAETLVPVACSIAKKIPSVAQSMQAHQANCDKSGLPNALCES